MKISNTKKVILLVSGMYLLSVIGLGLSVDSYINGSGDSILTDDQKEFVEHQKTYSNVNFVENLDKLDKLLDTKGRFLLYVGTEACAWCRVSQDIDERVVADRGSEFEDGQTNGLFRNISAAFDGTANGPTNDKTLNDTYPMYALHDLKATSVSQYHSSGTSKKISDVLLGKLDDREDIKLVSPVPFENNQEITLSSDTMQNLGTKASSYKEFYDAFNRATEYKIRSGTTSLQRQKNSLMNQGTYGTPSWWAIIDGQPRYLVTSYLTRAAIKGFAGWFLSNDKTVAQLDNELIT